MIRLEARESPSLALRAGVESDDPEVQPGTVTTFPDGFQAIVTNGGVYFEGHVFKVIGYDAAGNKAESDEVRVYVRHKKK